MTIMIEAPDGVGKTYALCGFKEQIALGDTEFPKANETIRHFYSDSLIRVFPLVEYFKKSDPAKGIKRGHTDIEKTVELYETNIGYICDNAESFQTIAIESISDFRDVYYQKWLIDNPSVVVGGIKKKRESIGKDNLGAWADINNGVKNLLFPLINTCRITGTTLVFTCKVKDEYKNIFQSDGSITSLKMPEKIADVKEWFPYRLDMRIRLSRTDNPRRYWLHWLRANAKDLPEKEDITNKSLYQILLERNLL